MNTIKDAVSDRDILILVALAAKVCGEKFPPNSPLVAKQIEKLREEAAKILTKIDEKAPGLIADPSDGRPWRNRSGRPK